MNDAMPQWRTFSADAIEHPPSTPPAADPASHDRRPAREGWIVAGLVGLAGAALGAVLVVLAVVAISATPGSDLIGPVGEPLPGWPEAAGEAPTLADGASAAASEEIVVDVAGAVVMPGLHRLRSGDRVGDAIEAAGGFAPRVDVAEAARSLNLAEALVDGSKVLVPELGVTIASDSAPDDARIDLNTADQATLETLPGIGPVTAGKIIAARAEQPFGEVGDLRSRGIVGESVFEQIRELVRVGR